MLWIYVLNFNWCIFSVLIQDKGVKLQLKKKIKGTMQPQVVQTVYHY